MENKDLIKHLSTVCSVLNQIDVRGKQNLMNLSGSIDILETIITNLQKDLQEKTSKEKE